MYTIAGICNFQSPISVSYLTNTISITENYNVQPSTKVVVGEVGRIVSVII